jgi:hypothetical protein
MKDMPKVKMGNMFCSYNRLYTLDLVFQFQGLPYSATTDANIPFPNAPINSPTMFSTKQ